MSKKEKKAKEDEEFEKLMAEMGVAAAKDEGKKKKKKAKKEETKEEKKEEAKPEGAEVKELTPEEKEAAVKAAREKRGLIQQKVSSDKSSIAN